jgi:hypothetical protein
LGTITVTEEISLNKYGSQNRHRGDIVEQDGSQNSYSTRMGNKTTTEEILLNKDGSQNSYSTRMGNKTVTKEISLNKMRAKTAIQQGWEPKPAQIRSSQWSLSFWLSH